jgi:hypothetical protein
MSASACGLCVLGKGIAFGANLVDMEYIHVDLSAWCRQNKMADLLCRI